MWVKFTGDQQDGLALDALVATNADPQIVATKPDKFLERFPAGFEDVDITILDWIAAARAARRA